MNNTVSCPREASIYLAKTGKKQQHDFVPLSVKSGKKALASARKLGYNTGAPLQTAQKIESDPSIAQLVARVVWDHQVGGSSPFTRTIKGL